MPSSVAAIVAVRDDRGRVLLVWQTTGPYAGTWLLPGGAVEADESAGHAAARELREETGLTLADGALVCAYAVRVPSDERERTVFLFRATASGTVRPERGSDARWFAPGAIPEPHPALRRELFDAGARSDEEAAIERALGKAGITMTRLA